MSRKRTLSEVITKANKTHGDKYDYSLVKDYKNNREKVSINCNVHGVFLQALGKHIDRKQGCPICANNVKLTNDEFIIKAKQTHGDKYDYSLVEYKTTLITVDIICNKCSNIFKQTPNNHLTKKQGCPSCNGGVRIDRGIIIDRLNIIHNNKYIYSDTIFVSVNDYVNITCPSHGVFTQSLNTHLYRSYGCPICCESKGEKQIRVFLEENDISYMYQKRFDGCIDKRTLPFDFYLPELNICVEYDGKQHYEVNEFFGGEEEFKERQKRDEIKNIYCKENDIKLLRIRYDDDINKKILEVLNGKI